MNKETQYTWAQLTELQVETVVIAHAKRMRLGHDATYLLHEVYLSVQPRIIISDDLPQGHIAPESDEEMYTQIKKHFKK